MVRKSNSASNYDRELDFGFVLAKILEGNVELFKYKALFFTTTMKTGENFLSNGVDNLRFPKFKFKFSNTMNWFKPSYNSKNRNTEE